MDLKSRLEEVMAAKGWTHADLVRVSGQTSSVVSQWLGKGSKVIKSIAKVDAACRIQDESGYRAAWIAEGKGPKLVDRQHLVSEPAQPYLTHRTVLREFGRLLAAVSPEMRPAFADVLSAWAREGGQEDRCAALIALVEASTKHAKAA